MGMRRADGTRVSPVLARVAGMDDLGAMARRTDYGTCAVCGKEPGVGIAAIPGVPASDVYGRECLDANAHPLWALVANTAMVGGYDQAAPWWQDMVDDTLRHLQVPREAFDADVAAAMLELE